MANDKKKSNKQNQMSEETVRPESIDVRSSEGETSDSELDIHALLRKYMPEYDKEDHVESDNDDDDIVIRLKESDDAEQPEITETIRDDDSMLSALDSIFAPADEAVEDALPPLSLADDPLEEDSEEYTFTNDIPGAYDHDGELEDEEGIYEPDDEPEETVKPKKRFSLFSFGKKKKTKAAAAEEPLYTEEREALYGQDFGYTVPAAETASEEPENTYADKELPAEETAEEVPFAAASLFSEDTNKVPAEPAAADNDMSAEETESGFTLEAPEEENAEAEENAEDMPALDDAFDPTDINLMIAFGMDEEEGKGKKKNRKSAAAEAEVQDELHQAAVQEGDRLEAKSATHEVRKVHLDRPEFVDRSQVPKIKKEYQSKMLSLWIRLGLCAVFTVLLMLFENIEVFAKLFTGTAKQFGGAFDPAVYPVVYAMVSLQLMLLACLCAYEEIIAGIKALFRGTPKPESITGLMMIAGIIYTAVIALITVQSNEPAMFNFTVAFAALMTIVAAIFNTKREMICFKVVSSSKDKHIVCRIPDEQSQHETDAFAEDTEVCDVMKIEKTEFVDGFFTRLCTPDGTVNVFVSCIMGIMVAAAILFGVFGAVCGNTATEVAQIVCVALMMLAPMPVYLSFSYPFYRANKAAKEYDSAIVGESSLEEYSNASVVTFDDKNIFPSYSVRVQNLRIYNNARIDRVLYYAASVFAHAGGPLQDVFEVATMEMGHSENVKIYDTEAGFLAAEVDGVNIIFGSGAALTRRGFEITREQAEDDVDLSDELSIMYMFREDKLVCKMYIQYGMDSDIEMILSQFRTNGLYVCVRTFDPNIDERMIARKVHMKNMPLKVIRYASMDEVGAYEEKVDSGLVTCGSPKSLLQVISYCDKVLHTRKTNIALNILAVIIGAAVMTLLVLADSIGLMSSVFIILYQLLWIVPMLLSSKVFVR
ncbi:MAG: hypothetical protein IJ325_07455 [Clostridia bacterium]|nr:hypothetical protein [Clostridia bacterium]